MRARGVVPCTPLRLPALLSGLLELLAGAPPGRDQRQANGTWQPWRCKGTKLMGCACSVADAWAAGTAAPPHLPSPHTHPPTHPPTPPPHPPHTHEQAHQEALGGAASSAGRAQGQAAGGAGRGPVSTAAGRLPCPPGCPRPGGLDHTRAALCGACAPSWCGPPTLELEATGRISA